MNDASSDWRGVGAAGSVSYGGTGLFVGSRQVDRASTICGRSTSQSRTRRGSAPSASSYSLQPPPHKLVKGSRKSSGGKGQTQDTTRAGRCKAIEIKLAKRYANIDGDGPILGIGCIDVVPDIIRRGRGLLRSNDAMIERTRRSNGED